MNKFWYKIKKFIFKQIGDLRWHGWTRPFFLTFNAKTYDLNGKHYRQIASVIRPGDIILTRDEGWIDTYLIPGFWTHAGVYVGNYNGEKRQVIHAISEGVIAEDLIDVMRTDACVILRANPYYASKCLDEVVKLVGEEYDFNFDFLSSLRFSCTELVAHNYREIISGKKRFGRYTIIADDIYNSGFLRVIYDSRKSK